MVISGCKWETIETPIRNIKTTQKNNSTGCPYKSKVPISAKLKFYYFF